MKIIAIIPARGGSKGILKKNIALLAGRPLISYTIEAAIKADCFNKIIISTDDQDIANISELYGVQIIKRPDVISKDRSQVEATIFHVLEELYRQKYDLDIVVLLNCTSPLRSFKDISGCLALFKAELADTALTVMSTYGFFWKYKDNRPGFLHRRELIDMHQEEATCVSHDLSLRRPMRQEFDNLYKEAGGIFIMDRKGFMENRALQFGKTVIYQMPHERCIDIDTREDLEYAEYLLRRNTTN